MTNKFNNVVGEPTELPHDAGCTMCGRIGNREDLAIKDDEWVSNGWNLCWDCYMGRNEHEKNKGLWRCYIGDHKWHPILTNPKVCYRCEFRWNNTIFPRKGASRFKFLPSWLNFMIVEDKQ